MSKKTVIIFSLVAMLFAFSGGVVYPASAADFPSADFKFEDRYLFTSQEPGTSLLIFATVITECLKEYLPAHVELDIIPTGATLASNTMVNDGIADIGFSEAGGNWAVQGILLFDRPHTKIRSIGGGFQFVQNQAFMTSAFATRHGIETFDDIKEKKPPIRLYTKVKGTMGQVASELQLEAYGITYDDIRAWGGSIVETSVPDIVDAMRDNRADVWLDNLAPGHPAATELFQLADIRLIKHSPEGLEKIYPYGFYPDVVPAGAWRGNDFEVTQPGSTTYLIANEDVSEEFVYLLCKALDEHQERIRAAHSLLEHFDMSKAWELVSGVELHPGALRYYREKGYME